VAKFRGSDLADTITPTFVSPGVAADPPGSLPGVNDTIYGQQGDDTLQAGSGNYNRLYGNEGDDVLKGGTGSDFFYGDAGIDTMEGGTGHDTYVVDNALDIIIESSDGAGGDDHVNAGVDWVLADGLESLSLTAAVTYFEPGSEYLSSYYSYGQSGTGNAGDNYLEGNQLANSLYGMFGNDTLFGAGNNDTLVGGAGKDVILGRLGDVVDGGIGNDTLSYAVDGRVQIDLGTGVVTFLDHAKATSSFVGIENATGGNRNDILIGSGAANVLRGDSGHDKFFSGNGADTLIGGTGNDTFKYNVLRSSTPDSRDSIAADDGRAAFELPGVIGGDKIDLAGIDANRSTTANDAFLFGGTGRGHVWAVDSGSDTIIRANVDADAAAEFELLIADGTVLASAYTAEDFIL
jgi:Ca2+-binding RTX toxin-like protein